MSDHDNLSEAPTGAVYRIEITHDPQQARTPWDWRVIDIQEHKAVAFGYMQATTDDALLMARRAIYNIRDAAAAEDKRDVMLYANTDGEVLGSALASDYTPNTP